MNPALLALSAEVIVIDAQTASGQGAVRLDLDGQHAEAAAFTLSLTDNHLTLIAGTWLRPDGDRLSFARAELSLGADLTGVLLEARYTGERFVASGETLTLLDADTLEGTALTVTVCGCTVPTWDITARAVTVELDEVARFTGGWIRVCERRVLPVPVGIVPLAERRSGLLPPQPGYGQDGLILAQPAYLTLGESADLTLTPEWRAARGLRARSTLRYALAPGQGGQIDAALGPDISLPEAPWRGAVGVRHDARRGALRTAVDARYQSDADYLADYGEDFLSRSQPWMESRALLSGGPLRLETDTFQLSTPALQRPLGAVISGVATPGPVSTFGFARLDLFAEGADPFALSAPVPRLRAGLRADYGRQLSLLRAELRGMGEGISWAEPGAVPWGWMGAEGEVVGMLWGDVGRWRHLADVGVVALSGVSTPGAVRRAPDEVLPVSGAVGPTVTSQWLSGGGGVPLSVSARAPWAGPQQGWLWQVTARWRAGAWSGRLQAEPALAYAEAGWAQERRSLRLTGAWLEADVLQIGGQGRWTLPGALHPLQVGWGHLYDVGLGETVSAGPLLGYRSPCDCLEIAAGATWNQDREVPDIRLSLKLE